MTTMKTAIVTGASSGIGLGLTTALMEHGYRVVANSRQITQARTLPPPGSGARERGYRIS